MRTGFLYSGLAFATVLLILNLTGNASNSDRQADAVVSSDQHETGATGVLILLDKVAGQASVHVRGDHFTTYHFHEENRIPYLWPVYAEGGISITRNWPMGEDQPESKDHPHHLSIWTAYGDVNGFDHWHSEVIRTVEISVESGEDYGSIHVKNIWLDDQGNPLLDEMREYRFFDSPASKRYFDQVVTFRATYGSVTFGDDKEGLFAFRIRPEIQGNRNGILTNAAGQRGERNVYGKPVSWMSYTGPVGNAGIRGIALFTHPDNFRLPAWHVRDYGLVAGNFFAMQDVAGMDEEGTYLLEKNDELTLKVRYLVYSGSVEDANISSFFESYGR
jgi:hypothetical protein